jgi:hypothetical protein
MLREVRLKRSKSHVFSTCGSYPYKINVHINLYMREGDRKRERVREKEREREYKIILVRWLSEMTGSWRGKANATE